MVSLKHKFVSTKTPVNDASLVRPNNWNDEHDLSTTAASVYLGQTSEPGPVKELPIQARTGDNYTMYTKAAVDAAIAVAIAAYHPFSTGDIAATVAASKTGGWVLCNGQSLLKANGDSNHDLFVMLWALPAATGMWPVLPNRGATAQQDWDLGKQVPVPDMRGAVPGMVDASGLISKLGIKVGTDKLSLTVPNLPTHTHAVPANVPAGPTMLTGTGARGTVLTNDGTSGATGGDPAATPANSVPVPINPTQPTVGVNFFIKL